MLRATALARLRLYSQPASDPVLTEVELGTILDLYATADATGLGPAETGWSGAWDIRAAARQAWLTKASKVVADIDYDLDGARYTASQQHAHCIKMADSYADQGVASIGSL